MMDYIKLAGQSTAVMTRESSFPGKQMFLNMGNINALDLGEEI